MVRSTLLVVTILLIAADLVNSNYVAKQFVPKTRHGWQITGDAESDTPMKITIALKEQNYEQIERIALDISNPDSPNWGNQLTFEELVSLSSPDHLMVKKVVAWLMSNGIRDIQQLNSQGYLTFEATVGQVENLVKCDIVVYSASERDILRCKDAYWIHSELSSIIEFIAPLHGFPRHSLRKLQSSDPEPADNVSISMIQKIYQIPDIPDLKVNNTQAVWEDSDSYSNADLTLFLQTYAPKVGNQKIVATLGDTPNVDDEADTEASLDVQMIMAIGAFAPSYSYNYDESDILQAFLHWVTDLANDPEPILVHSVSWGEYGGDYPIDMVIRISNEWMKLGTRGVTVFVASGDDGVGCNDDCTAFEFPYPSSPWVTLVGSTQLQVDSSSGAYSEIGSSFSSGGFSNDFTLPDWQKTQVQYYLNNCPTLPQSSFYNATGRALPDISAVGENIIIIMGGEATTVDGTSCSSPIWAGMMSIINGYRLKDGKKPIGFLNPLLYKAYSADRTIYQDITSGNNADGCCPGFDAYAGWDPVTGLGTPNLTKLLQYIKNLP